MFKNLISPVQAWLLSKGKKQENKVICKCGRIYVNDNGKYRRAELGEA